MANANADKAVWLTDGFTPGLTASGVLKSANASAKAYPMVPQMDLLHTALGASLADFMQGKKDAAATLT